MVCIYAIAYMCTYMQMPAKQKGIFRVSLVFVSTAELVRCLSQTWCWMKMFKPIRQTELLWLGLWLSQVDARTGWFRWTLSEEITSWPLCYWTSLICHHWCTIRLRSNGRIHKKNVSTSPFDCGRIIQHIYFTSKWPVREGEKGPRGG